MANGSVPKHDFAPAWLKIRGESQSNFHGERLSRRDEAPSAVLGRQRQSSCDQQYPRRDRHYEMTSSSSTSRHQQQHNTQRHHSIDVDECQYYNNGSSEMDFSRQFGSQPSLNRRTQNRPENSFFTSSYRGVSRNNGGGWNRVRKSVPNNKDAKEMKETPTDRFNLEFPSLRGDSNDTMTSSMVNGGVWSANNLRNTKIYLDTSNKTIQSADCRDGDGRSSSPGSFSNGNSSPVVTKPSSQNQSSTSLYRVLVPSKNLLSRKPLAKPSLTNTNSNSNSKVATTQSSSPTSTQLDILNTRLVTHPKNLTNKKSDFLRTLRNEEHESSEEKDGSDCRERNLKESEKKKHENGKDADNVSDCTVKRLTQKESKDDGNEELAQHDGSRGILSSSLEAEQRLLKQMGWKEEGSGDEDVYAPLTEDELREFEILTRKIHEQKSMSRPTWSPKKRIPFGAATCSIVELDDDSCSTTSSDSE